MKVVLSLRQQLSDETSQRQADYDERMGKLTEQYNDLLQQVSSTALRYQHNVWLVQVTVRV